MIFQHTWQKVLSGEKTSTRRLVKPSSAAITHGGIIHEVFDGSLKKHYPTYCVGKTYAVQPGRGQKSIARIRITGIRLEDVRNISDEDLRAEGFHDAFHFLWTWTKMHDKPAWTANQKTDFSDGDESGWMSHPVAWVSWLKGTRPAERYQAWVIEFELADDASR